MPTRLPNQNCECHKFSVTPLGNAWMEISEFLPGRTAGEVKNIYHSTLRASRDPGRSLLRSYCMQIHGREADAKLRREALRSAMRAMAPQGAVASKALRQAADGLEYGEADDEPGANVAAAATMRLPCLLDAGVVDAMLASRDAGLAQLRLLAAATGGDDWESDEGSGGGGGVAVCPGHIDAGAAGTVYDRLPRLLCAGLGSGAAPPQAGMKRAAPAAVETQLQHSPSTGSGDASEMPAEDIKRARMALLPDGADPDVGLGRLSSGGQQAHERLLGAASLRDGNTRLQTLDLSGGGAGPGAAAHRLLAQQLQVLQQAHHAQQLQQQLREMQQGQGQSLQLPDAALLQLLGGEVQARSRAPLDSLQAMVDGTAQAAAAGQTDNAPTDNPEATPAASAGAGSGPRNTRGRNGGGCISQNADPTGPAAMPSTQQRQQQKQQQANGVPTTTAPRSPAAVTPMGGGTGAASASAAANALALAPAHMEASLKVALSHARDSAGTASATAVGSGHDNGRGVASNRGASGPGTSAWEAEQRHRMDRMLSYGISLDEIEEELLRRRQAKLAAEAAALGEAAAALAAGRRDVVSPAAVAPAQATVPLALPQVPKNDTGAGTEQQLKLEEQQNLLQRLQALQSQPQLPIKADPDEPMALDAQALRRQLLLELLKQQAGRQQQQLPVLHHHQHLTREEQQQLCVEGMLRLNTYAPAGAGRGLPDLTLQAAPATALCGSVGMQASLPLGAPRGVGDLDAWLRSAAPDMWS
eukprot:XP_001699705.1 predicted protein [Chlamydomonas reinhardtii]